MDYAAKFEETYALARQYRAQYLRNELEDECRKMMETVCDFSISDEDYEKIILPYWEKYGVKPEKFWFEFFGSRDKKMDPAGVPGYIYFSELIPYLNNPDFCRAFADKCYLDRLLSNAKMPETVVRCIAGLYYDIDMNRITETEAVKLCIGHNGKIIIKPSLYSCSSRNTFSIDPAETDEKKMLDTFRLLGANFVVQDRVKQHKDLAKLNPGTVNTIRVHSLLTDEGVYIPSAILRVGAPGQDVVEAGSGGYYCDISDDNKLVETSYRVDVIAHIAEDGTELRNHILIPTTDKMGGKYEGDFVIPAMDKIKDMIREIHPRIPHLRFVGWDFTVDESGEPVMFEFNISSDAQIFQLTCCKPIFGEKTEWVLEDYYKNRTLEKKQRQGIIIL